MGVLRSVAAGVGTVTMDWPDSRNALDTERITAVVRTIEDVASQDVHAIVLSGNRAFCAGANLRQVADRPVPAQARQREIEGVPQSLVRAIVDAPVPVFAAIDGPAIGFGFDVALACDSRLIGPTGWCMQGWGRVGVIPGTGGELLLRRLNPSLLWRLLETQPRITAADAERWGIGEAVTEGSALSAAIRRGEALAQLPLAAVRAYTALSREALRRDLPAHLADCAARQGELLADPELSARITSLLAATRGTG